MSTDLNYYLDHLTSEHRGHPNLTALLTSYVKGFVDGQVTMLGLPRRYDLDFAVGAQLDVVGLWIGQSRYVQDIPYVGGILTRLNDDYYRKVLRARIISDHWDGTIPGAYNYWDALFGGEGLQVQIYDNQDMTIEVLLLGSTDPIINGLFVAGLLFVKPVGVAVTYAIA